MVPLSELAKACGIGSRQLPNYIITTLRLEPSEVTTDWRGQPAVTEESAADVYAWLRGEQERRRATKQDQEHAKTAADHTAEGVLAAEAARAQREAEQAAIRAGSPHWSLAGVVAAQAVRRERQGQPSREEAEIEARAYWRRAGGDW